MSASSAYGAGGSLAGAAEGRPFCPSVYDEIAATAEKNAGVSLGIRGHHLRLLVPQCGNDQQLMNRGRLYQQSHG
jgi:hypothetical protein